MPRRATSLFCTNQSLLISTNRIDRFHSVMGPAGVGKSSVGSHGWMFLLTSHLVIHFYSSSTPSWARKRHKVGHDLRSCTATLQPFVDRSPPRRESGPRRLVLVDTPGFDDTNEENPEILRRIAVWLASS
jgi:hypothetical protein